jgi:hypothetical protein
MKLISMALCSAWLIINSIIMIWYHCAEVRISLPSSQGTIQVRVLKFVNDNSNSTNLKVNLCNKALFLFVDENSCTLYDTTDASR